MISYLELLYSEPRFASLGTPIPDKHGHVDGCLKDKVRASISFHYTIKNGTKLISDKCYYAVYDEDGQLRHREESDKKGNLIRFWNYCYDENGRCRENFEIDSKGIITTKYVYEYNEKNLLFTSEWIDEEGSCGKHAYYYDERGFVVEEQWNAKTPSSRWKCLYKYDENGHETEMHEYRCDYKGNYWFLRKNLKYYDNIGRLIKHIYVGNDDKKEDLSIDEYDERGRCVNHKKYLFFFYDFYDRLIETKDANGKIINKVLYNADNTITIIWFDKEDFHIKEKREIFFDEHNNISSIRDYEGMNLDLVKVISYKYEYYP